LDDSITQELDPWIRAGGSFVSVNCSTIEYDYETLSEYDSIGNATVQLTIKGQIIPESYDTNGTRVLHWYMNDNIQLYPFLTSKAKGFGQLMSLNLWPLFSSILESKYQDSGRLSWRVLPNIWSIINLDKKPSSVSDILGVALSQGPIRFVGETIVRSSSILFEGDCFLECIDNDSDVVWSGHLRSLSIIGHLDLELAASNLTIGISNLINFVRIASSQNISLSVSIKEPDEMVMVLMNSNMNETITLHGGTHILRFSPADSIYSLHLDRPLVSCNGTTSFTNLYAAKPFKVYIPGFSTDVRGLTQFRIVAAQNSIEFTNLTIIGSLDIDRGEGLEEITTAFNSAFSNVLFIPILSAVLVGTALLNFKEIRQRIKKNLRRFMN